LKVKEESVGQQNQRTGRHFLGIWARNKPLKDLTESVAKVGQGNVGATLDQMTESVFLEENLIQDIRLHANSRTSPFLFADRPSSFACGTLTSSMTKPVYLRLTTGGFRMFWVHACELSHRLLDNQRENDSFGAFLSTEFLYPTPMCDLKSSAFFASQSGAGFFKGILHTI
jgi:hypothetical protein